MWLCVSENLSPRISQDEFVDIEQQQQPASHHDNINDDDDNDDDDDNGSVDETDMRRDENAHRHPGDRYLGDHLPAAESHSHHHDVAVQVDDLTRQSSSTQASCCHYQSTFSYSGSSCID